MRKRLSIGQNALYNTVGAFVYALCQWLMTVVAINVVSVETGGIFSLAMSYTNMFFTLATCGLHTFQASDRKDEYSTSEYVTTRLCTCAAATVICAVSLCFTGYGRYHFLCIIVYMLYRVVEAINDSFQAIQQKADRMDLTGASFAMRGIFSLAAFYAVLRLTQDLLTGLAVITVTTAAVVFFWDLFMSRKLTRIGIEFHPGAMLRLLRVGLPLALNSFLTAFMVSYPRTILSSAFGDRALGIYGAVAAPTVIIQSAAIWLYSPAVTTYTACYAKKDRQGFFRLYGRMCGIIFGAIALAIAGAALLGRSVLALVFGAEVAEYSGLLIPIILTVVLVAFSYYYSALLTIIRRLGSISFSNAAGVVMTLLFARRLVLAHGMMGVNYAVFLGMGVNVVLMCVLFHYHLVQHFRE